MCDREEVTLVSRDHDVNVEVVMRLDELYRDEF